MNIRQLEFFVAVYEEGSFTHAAERVHGTQPGLSAQIKQLEEELDQALFVRSVGGAEPTEAGRRLYDHAISILRSVEEVRVDMDALNGEVAGLIRFGLVPSAVRGLAPTLFSKFVEAYPLVRMTMKEAYSSDLTDYVRAGELDFAVVIEPPETTGLTIRKLTEELMVLISGPAMKQKQWAPLDLSKAAPLKLVTPSVSNGLRQNIEHQIRAGAIRIEKLIEMDSVHASIEFIKRSDWCTILPSTAMANELSSKELILNPITHPDVTSDFFLVHRTQVPISVPAQAMIELMSDAFSKLGDAVKHKKK
ncbi:MAG: LysR family transcriptional regulator [Proteobacteria bacterium]|nr:LysR family transcriptional regulator [Pseudomonadota bacterium]